MDTQLPRGASLIRAGTNNLFHYENYIFRVTPRDYDSILNPALQLKAASLLLEAGIPTPCPDLDWGIRTEGAHHVITRWTFIQNTRPLQSAHEFAEAAVLAKSLTQILEPLAQLLPHYTPLPTIKARLESMPEDSIKQRLLDEVDALNPLPSENITVIHGDLHPGNFFVHNDSVYILDFDRVSLGHIADDATPIAVQQKHGMLNFKAAETFINTFGHHPSPSQVRIRELLAITWLASNFPRQQVEKELHIRIDSLQKHKTPWTAY